MASEPIHQEMGRALVVDDERHIAHFLRFVLKRAGYDVAIVYNGEQALAAAEAFAPDVVLLDLGLPGLTGLELLKRLRGDSRYANLVVIVLSAHPFGDMPAELMAAGATAYCPKPIAPSTLLKTLADLGLPPAAQAPRRSPLSNEVRDGDS